MKTIELTTYGYRELSSKAKEKARAWFREGLEYDGECQNEDSKQCAAFLGFDVKNIWFSGFSSQGDGACFDGTWCARDVNATALKEHAPIDSTLHRLADEFERIAKAFLFASFTVAHRGYYCHKFCTDFTFSIVDENGDEITGNDADKAERDLTEASRDLMEWIYCQLEKDYYWRVDDEQIADSIECNGYAFTVDGKRSVTL